MEMVAGNIMRIHGAGGNHFSEVRLIDTAELRLAEIVAGTQPSCVGVLRDRLTGSIDEFGISLSTGPAQVCMAIEEALANAFYHGNLELDSKLKEDGSNRFSDLAKQRCQQSPWKDREIRITELVTPYGVWFTISDEGRGYNVASAIKRIEDPMSILSSGRGLVMMKAFTDQLVFNHCGNEVTLVIYSNRNIDVKELLQERVRTRSLKTRRRSLI